MKFTLKKKIVAVAVAAGVVVTAGAAYAYWNATVSTTPSNGTVTADGATSNVAVSAGSISSLRPDGVAVNVPVTLTNNNTYSVAIPAGHLSGAWVSASGTCTQTLANLTIGNPVIPAQVLAASGGHTVISVPVSMADSGTSTDQSPCQGATITLAFTAGA